MAETSAPSLIHRLTTRRRRAVRAPEPADLGTAFGMERWLDDSASAASAATTAPSGEPGWRNLWLAKAKRSR